MSDVVVIGCLPADDVTNRAYAKLLQIEGDWRWPAPHAGSTEARCEHCQGVIWLGPEQQAERGRLIQAGTHHLMILCVFDAALQQLAWRGAGHQVTVRSLLDEERGQ
jgi:hypothetical protein